MNKEKIIMALCSAILLAPSTLSAKQWTLKECISYALQNNIQLQKTLIQKQIATENWLQSKAAMLPSLPRPIKISTILLGLKVVLAVQDILEVR